MTTLTIHEFAKAKSEPQTTVDLATLPGPPVEVEQPGDCPGYGRELPASWACQHGCPLMDDCYRAYEETVIIIEETPY